jgi:oxygen-independent coproporphyrinogen-3 oxidase
MNSLEMPPATTPVHPAPPLPKETTVGNYFVSNYPPFAYWKPEFIPDFLAALERPPSSILHPSSSPPLGLYCHIPFCRKRCHFCYFKVYTDKDSQAIRGYLDALLAELTIYAGKPFVGGRKPGFVYFGGGTPELPERRATALSHRRHEAAAAVGRGRGSHL